jgi:hypothetical protein
MLQSNKLYESSADCETKYTYFDRHMAFEHRIPVQEVMVLPLRCISHGTYIGCENMRVQNCLWCLYWQQWHLNYLHHIHIISIIIFFFIITSISVVFIFKMSTR